MRIGSGQQIWIAMIVAIALLASGTPSFAQSGTVVVTLWSEPDSLDPAITTVNGGRSTVKNIYESLVDLEKGSVEPKPALATAWQVSPDGLTYTFTLRRGVTFTDGSPWNAEAARFGIERTMKIQQGPAWVLRAVKAVEATDESTLRISLKEPYAAFLDGLVLIAFPSPTAVRQNEKDGDLGRGWLRDHAVGTGPFKLDRWDPGQQLTLVRNDQYWRGWNGPHVTRVIHRFIKEPATQRLMLEKGDLDLSSVVSVDDLPALQRNKDLVVQAHPTWWVFSLQMNTQKGPLKDVRVRKAIAYLFDYEGHNKGAMKGMVQPAHGPFPPEMVGKSRIPGVVTYSRDVEKAQALLREAGLGSGGAKLSMNIIAGFDEHKKAAEILQANLAEVGIQLHIQEMNGPTWTNTNTTLETAPDIVPYWAVPAFNNPDAILSLIYHSRSQGKNGRNWMYYQNPRVDDLIDQARAVLDPTKRNALYENVARLITEDCPVILVNRPLNVTPHRAWLKGYYYNPAYLYMYRFYEMWLDGKPS
jgi:peptide/nickel transport system substrate-binding protein